MAGGYTTNSIYSSCARSHPRQTGGPEVTIVRINRVTDPTTAHTGNRVVGDVLQRATGQSDRGEDRMARTYRLRVDVDADTGVGHLVRTRELDEVLTRRLGGAGALEARVSNGTL